MKKQFFSTAVAFIAALSLSASAFAEGGSRAGFSYAGGSQLGASEPSYGEATIGVNPTATATYGDYTLDVQVNGSLFPGYTKIKVEFKAWDASKDAKVAAEVAEAADFFAPGYPVKVYERFEIVLSGIPDGGTEYEEVQPDHDLLVTFTNVYDKKDSPNAIYDPVASLDKDKLLELSNEGNTCEFYTNHFSVYYVTQVSDKVFDTTDRPEEPIGPGEPTPTPPSGDLEDPGTGSGSGSGSDDNSGSGSGSDSSNGSDSNNSSSNNNNNSSSNNNNNNNNNSSNNNNSGNGTNNNGGSTNNGDDSNGNNSNVGNDGAGAGADKNQATGVVLTVIPAAVAAVAVIISKKRK